MRNAQGYLSVFDPEGTHREEDSFTCFHCNKIVFVPARASPTSLGGLCYVCNELICPACVEKGACDPLEEKLKRQEARAHALRSYGL